jgi:glycosyltransferase involved in cell wall biosynthesis
MESLAGKTETVADPRVRLGLFFTFEMSLAAWNRAGILERELVLYRELAKSGVQSVLFTYGDDRDTEYGSLVGENITVVPMMNSRREKKWRRFFGSWLAPLSYGKQIRECNIVKTNQMWGAWTGLISKLVWRKKWILRCGFEHHFFLLKSEACLRDRIFSRMFSKLAYSLADRVIWSSSSEADWAQRYFRLKEKKDKYCVIPNYVDTRRFLNHRAETRRGILAVGRLTEQKCFDKLITALAGMEQELVIVGEGELRDPLGQLAESNGVEVVFKGVLLQEKLAELMGEKKIFVLPSEYEGSPKVLLEAMASGMAVVCTDLPETREIVTHREDGILCANGPEELRAVLEELLGDEELCNNLGKGAVRTIEERFSLEKTAEKELELYGQLAGINLTGQPE